MNEKQQKLLKDIDSLIEEIAKDGSQPSKEVESLISDISDQVKVIKSKKRQQVDDGLAAKIEQLIVLFTQSEALNKASTQAIVEAISKIKQEAPIVNVSPPEVNVTVPEIKVPPIQMPAVNVPKTQVNIPDEVNIRKPGWLTGLFPFSTLFSELKAIKELLRGFKLPKNASDAISVRLSDGEKFYRALGGMATAIGASFPFKTSDNEQVAGLVDDDGRQYINETESTFDHGRNSDVDTSAERITTTSISAKKGVLVKAANANTGIIYVGNSDVTANSSDSTDGFELGAGESLLVRVDNVNKVYVIASTNNQSVYWFVV